MDHASGAVAPPDAEVVQVGDAIRQRAEWRGLVQGAVWPVRVVEVLVLAPKTRIRRVLQPHKPKIIPRPGSQARTSPPPAGHPNGSIRRRDTPGRSSAPWPPRPGRCRSRAAPAAPRSPAA